MLLDMIAQQENINLEQVVAIGDGANDLQIYRSINDLVFNVETSGYPELTVSSNLVTIQGQLALTRETEWDGHAIIFEDSDGDYTGRITINDGQGNFSMGLNYDGDGNTIADGDGVAKIL